jgi:hypothetical protein
LEEHRGGIELAYHFLGVVVGEGHQGDKSLFFAYLKSLPKVFGLGVELVHVDRELGATIELLGPIDVIVDPLLIGVVEEVVGA